MKNELRSAFTLIEFLMLAVIVGVMAATIVPEFSTSARDAKLSNLKYNVRSVRSWLQTYKLQHGGLYPPAATSDDFANQMRQKSDPGTALNPAKGSCGPYTEGGLPINPFNNSSTVAILEDDAEPAGPTGSGDGWQYNPKHGWFYPNTIEYFQSSGSSTAPN